MTLTACGVGAVDIGFAASGRWQPVVKAELTTNMMAKIVFKLIEPTYEAEVHRTLFSPVSRLILRTQLQTRKQQLRQKAQPQEDRCGATRRRPTLESLL
jgi:hypothetical protein